jgi:hypothetical protein
VIDDLDGEVDCDSDGDARNIEEGNARPGTPATPHGTGKVTHQRNQRAIPHCHRMTTSGRGHAHGESDAIARGQPAFLQETSLGRRWRSSKDSPLGDRSGFFNWLRGRGAGLCGRFRGFPRFRGHRGRATGSRLRTGWVRSRRRVRGLCGRTSGRRRRLRAWHR